MNFPIPEPMELGDMRQTAQIWCTNYPILTLVYMSQMSSHVLLQVIKPGMNGGLEYIWYEHPNLHIWESLSYVFNTSPDNITATCLLVANSFEAMDFIEGTDPIIDYNHFLEFQWQSYGIREYVLQATIELNQVATLFSS